MRTVLFNIPKDKIIIPGILMHYFYWRPYMEAVNNNNFLTDLARKEKSLKQPHIKIKPSDSTVCNNCCVLLKMTACPHIWSYYLSIPILDMTVT